MSNRQALVSTALFSLLFVVSTGNANVCAGREELLSRLTVQHGESQKGMGLDSKNALVEIFTSADEGSWSLVVSEPGSVTSCMISAGVKYFSDSGKVPSKSKDGKFLHSFGISNNGNLLRIYVGEKSRDWNFTVTTPDGLESQFKSGTAWENTSEPLDKPGVDL